MTVRLAAVAENSLNSAERVLQYSDIPPEKYNGSDTAPQQWPTDGKVDFQQVSMRYRPDLPLVLKSLTVTVEPAHKIGKRQLLSTRIEVSSRNLRANGRWKIFFVHDIVPHRRTV